MTEHKELRKNSLILLFIIGLALFFMMSVTTRADAVTHNMNTKATVISQSQDAVEEPEITDPDDLEIITIEDSLVPLSATVQVEEASHGVAGGWILIVLAVVSVAGIVWFANRT